MARRGMLLHAALIPIAMRQEMQGVSASAGALLTLRSALPICGRMTLEERLKLAKEIAVRTKPQFVSDGSRHELRRLTFEKAKARTKAVASGSLNS